MELRHLRYLICVAEELHFGRAALRLGISQPPLSQQIRALEEELGVPLFERTSRRVTLTAAGRLFVEEARRTLDQADYAIKVARRAQQGEVGRLAIGFSASAPLTPLVARSLFAFRQAYPSVHLEMSETSREEQIAALREDRMDIVFLRSVSPPLARGLIVLKLLDEKPLVALRADHPLASLDRPLRVADLEGQPLVSYEYDQGGGITDHIFALCRNAGFEPDITVQVRGLATLIGMVAAGMGMTLLSRSLTVLHPENVVYREFDQSTGSNALWLVYREQPSIIGAHLIAIVEAERVRQSVELPAADAAE